MIDLIFHLIAEIVDSLSGKKEAEARKQRELAWRREQARQAARERAAGGGDEVVARGLTPEERAGIQSHLEAEQIAALDIDAPTARPSREEAELAAAIADRGTTGGGRRRLHPLVRKLQNPDTLRDAIIYREIFDRPPALRRRR